MVLGTKINQDGVMFTWYTTLDKLRTDKLFNFKRQRAKEIKLRGIFFSAKLPSWQHAQQPIFNRTQRPK